MLEDRSFKASKLNGLFDNAITEIHLTGVTTAAE